MMNRMPRLAYVLAAAIAWKVKVSLMLMAAQHLPWSSRKATAKARNGLTADIVGFQQDTGLPF